MNLLSWLMAHELTPPEWPESVLMQLPVSESHTFRVLSEEPETMNLLSWLMAHELTHLEWPESVLMQLPVSESHTFRVLS